MRPSKMDEMTRCYAFDSSNKTNIYNSDSRITAGGSLSNIFRNNNITVARDSALTIASSDAEVAKAGLSLASQLASNAFSAAGSLAIGANSIASQVADSQRSFVETASGQKTWLWGAGIAALVAIIFFWRKA